MSPKKDDILLSEFKKATRQRALQAYSNLDESFQEKFDFFVKRYEDIMKVTGREIPPHKWSYHRIGLVTNGEAKYTLGTHRFTARKNTLLIIPARTITTSSWSEDGKGYNTLFNPEFLLKNNLSYKSVENKGILQPSVHPYLSLSEVQSAEVEQIFQTMLKEDKEGNGYRTEMIAIKIVELLILCERFYAEAMDIKGSQLESDLVKKFTELIEKHFAEERTVGFYAEKLHVHPNHLNAVIKVSSGITAKESLQNRLILEAKYLLHTSNYSIKEIASQLGFDDPNYFTTFFKKQEKLSPVSYRTSFL